jgi:fluoride ion exporter CrcB/FEX
MDALLEFLFNLLGELLLQIVGQILFELGIHAVGQVFEDRKFSNPWFAGIGNGILGVLAGFLSLLIFHHSLVKHETFRLANLIIMPIVAGSLMWLIGRWRTKREQKTISLESFWQGFIFAFGMALVRFIYIPNLELSN